jgi:hypothetical protein
MTLGFGPKNLMKTTQQRKEQDILSQERILMFFVYQEVLSM